jgi:hypothetical protein
MVDESKSARTTISMPRQLKEQMDAVTEPVNWSALACRAFEAKLAELAAKKEQKDMKDVITRLRASKRRVEDEHYHQGEKAGREWGESDAEVDELANLQRWYARLGRDVDAVFGDDAWGRAYSSAELIAFAAWPERDGDRSAAEEFWNQCLGDDANLADDPQFVKGFVEGALELWDEVKDAVGE